MLKLLLESDICTQKTEEASLVLQILDSFEDEKEKVVFVAHLREEYHKELLTTLLKMELKESKEKLKMFNEEHSDIIS